MKRMSLSPKPIFTCQSHPELGDNINGPSVIRTPDWINDAPGKYLMYFAHHEGDHIRMAFADSPMGKWHLLSGGCLHLKDTPSLMGHIASPEAVIDDKHRYIRLYFHGYRQGSTIDANMMSDGQVSFCARSKDGLHFKTGQTELGPYYMRVFRRNDAWYAIAKNGYAGNILLRSEDGLSAFEHGPELLPRSRHVGLQRCNNGRLWVYYSRIGDAPERILKSELIMNGDWSHWHCGDVLEVKAPEYDWEGADCPQLPSKKGVAHDRVWQLRDPDVFSDIDGRHYLYYSIAGEKGIAVMELTEACS